MRKEIKYEPNGFITIGDTEWTWESLKQQCYSDYVYEDKTIGRIAYKYKISKEIISEWANNEQWELAKRTHWKRPYSYRIDGVLAFLLQQISKLHESQKYVHEHNGKDDFEFNSCENKVTINIETHDKNGSNQIHKIILEKHKVIVNPIYDEYGEKVVEEHEEMRYKVIKGFNEVTVKYRPVVKND